MMMIKGRVILIPYLKALSSKLSKSVTFRDWIHKEVACALNSHCNIIPVFDNFFMPEASSLPLTMQALTSYNGVKWIHDYQVIFSKKL